MIRKEDGQSLVEFALIIPLLLLLVVGLFDFGRIFYSHLQLELVSQEAVRIAGLGKSDLAIQTYARNEFHGNGSELLISISPTEGKRVSGDYVTVTLSYPEEFLDILGGFSIPYTVETSSTIRIE